MACACSQTVQRCEMAYRKVTKMEHLTNIPNLLVQSGKPVLKFLTLEINFSEAQHQLCY